MCRLSEWICRHVYQYGRFSMGSPRLLPPTAKVENNSLLLMDSLAGKLDIACRYRQWWMPFEVLVIELFVNSLLRRRMPASIKLIG